MCMDRVIAKVPKGDVSKKVYLGWKRFFTGGVVPVPQFMYKAYKYSMVVPLNMWITAEEGTVDTGRGQLYTSGFHIYRTYEAAVATATVAPHNLVDNQIYPVLYKEVTSWGEQDKDAYNSDCIIARKMYVPSLFPEFTDKANLPRHRKVKG